MPDYKAIYDTVLNSSLSREKKKEVIQEVHRNSIKPLAKDNLWAFAEYVMKDSKDGSYFKLQKFHREWCKMLENEQYLVLVVPMFFGKCLAKDTIVTFADGNRVKVQDVRSGDIILSMNDRYKIEPSEVIATECNGYRDILRITTQSGRFIDVTPNHKFYILGRGWVRADSLRDNDRIATPRYLPCKSDKPDNDRIELLGYLISEGSLSSNNFGITIYDEDILNRVTQLVTNLGQVLTQRKDKHDYYIKDDSNPGNRLKSWCKGIGIYGHTAHTKFIPDCVFTASEYDKQRFISALFSGDGTVNRCNHIVSYSTASKQLAHDLQGLLLHFGILSQIGSRYTGYNGKKFKSYRLSITNKESINNFNDTIIYLYPKYKNANLQSYTWDNTKGNLDGVPVVWKQYQFRGDNWYRKYHSFRTDINDYEVTSRERLLAIANLEDNQLSLFSDTNDILRDLAISDIFWDKVIYISHQGEELTYDIEVKGTHNFVANNFITHNTSIVSRAYPLWLLGNYPKKRIGLAGESERQPKKSLLSIMTYISASSDLKDVFPDLCPMPSPSNPNKSQKWAIDGIIVERSSLAPDYSIEPLGLSSTILSSRFDILIVDNVLSPENTRNKKRCQETNDWFDGVAKSRVERDGQIVVVDTPWRSFDLLSYLEKNPKYKVVKYSVEEGDAREGYRHISWPSRHSKENLEQDKRDNPIMYDLQRRSRPGSPQSEIFSRYMTDEVRIKEYTPQDGDIVFSMMDLSTETRKGTAIVTVAISAEAKTIIDVRYGAWSASEKAKNLSIIYQKYLPKLILIETNSMQRDTLGWLELSGYHFPTKGILTTAATISAAEAAMEVELKQKKWDIVAPVHHSTCNCDTCRFINELTHYGNYSSDDGVKALFLLFQVVRPSGMGIRVRSAPLVESKKKVFDKSDYYCYNKITMNSGFIPPSYYKEIASYIQDTGGIEGGQWNKNDMELVLHDIERFVDQINNR